MLGLNAEDDDTSPAVAAEAMTHRRALMARIAALLLDNDLPVTPLTLTVAHDCVTGENVHLAALVAHRISYGLPVDVPWLEQALRNPNQEQAAEQLAGLLSCLRDNITGFDRTTHGAMEANGTFTRALKGHLAAMEQDSPDTAIIASLSELTRTMLSQAKLLQAELAASHKRTAELQKTLAEAQRVADEDHLTGLANRRAFESQFGAALAAAKTTKAPLSVAVADIDHFKRINDRHGHAAGDRVLKVVAETLDSLSDAGCLVARLGGEEFGVIFPGRTMDQAFTLLDTARSEMAERRLINRTNDRPFGLVTFSAGIADVIACHDLDGSLKAADRALYAAKGAGRNRVIKADRAWSIVRTGPPDPL